MRGVVVAALLAGCAPAGHRLTEWRLDVAGGLKGVPVTLPSVLRRELPPGEADYLLSTEVTLDREQPSALLLDCFHGPLSLIVDGTTVPDVGDADVGSRRFVIPASDHSKVLLTFSVHRDARNSLGFGVAPRLVGDPGGDRRAHRIATFNRDSSVLALFVTLFLSFLYSAFFILDRRRRENLAIAVWAAANVILPMMQLGTFQLLFGSRGPDVQSLVGLVNLCAFLYFIHLTFELEPVAKAWLIALGVLAVTRIAAFGSFRATAFWMGPHTLFMIVVNLYGVFRLAQLSIRGERRHDARLLLSFVAITACCIFAEVLWNVTGRQQFGGVHPSGLGVVFQAVTQALVVSRQHVARQRTLEETTRELRRQVAERSRDLSKALARLQKPRAETIAPGQTIQGRYRILRKLGSGGMGTVHEVERISDGRRLALKTLHGHVDPESLARFAREAQIAAQLDHPNVVSVLDVDVSEAGTLFLVMELVSGSSLAGQNSRFGDAKWARPILRQIAAALAIMHESGIVHRDLKPANVLVDGDTAKVADFGIASLDEVGGADSTVSLGAGLTRSGAFMGTPMYMAPELERGARQATPASDLFALGVVAYQLLSGKLPFTEPPVLARLERRSPPRPPALEGELGALVDRCLSFDPAERPTAEEFRVALG